MDALRRSRRVLGEELGLDPGSALNDLDHAILAGRSEALRAISPPSAHTLYVTRPGEPSGSVFASGAAPDADPEIFVGREAELQGWTVVLGRCPEFDGAPPAWAWVEAFPSLAERVPPDDPDALSRLEAGGEERSAQSRAAVRPASRQPIRAPRCHRDDPQTPS